MSMPVLSKEVFHSLKLIKQYARKLNLKPVKQIEFRFDPFHKSVITIRQFLYYASNPKLLRNVPGCRIKTTVVDDRSDPILTYTLNNGEIIKLNTTNFSLLELLHLHLEHVACHDKPTEDLGAKSGKLEPVAKGKLLRKK